MLDMKSLEQRGNEGRDEMGPPAARGSVLGSGCWVVLAVLGRSLVELSSTLGVRLKNVVRYLQVKPALQIKNNNLQAGYVGGLHNL